MPEPVDAPDITLTTTAGLAGDGGHLKFEFSRFASGRGGRATGPGAYPGKSGPIIFAIPHPDNGASRASDNHFSDIEVVRFEADGRVFVRGELVDNNPAIWQAMAEIILSSRPHATEGFHLEWRDQGEGKMAALVPVPDDPEAWRRGEGVYAKRSG